MQAPVICKVGINKIDNATVTATPSADFKIKILGLPIAE